MQQRLQLERFEIKDPETIGVFGWMVDGKEFSVKTEFETEFIGGIAYSRGDYLWLKRESITSFVYKEFRSKKHFNL